MGPNDITSDTSSNNDTNDDMWSPTEHFIPIPLDRPQEPEQHVKKVATCLPCLVGQCKSHKLQPDLRFLAKELRRLRSVKNTKIGRVAVLKFSDSPEPFVVPDADTDIEELKKDLEKSGKSGGRFYILEDISNENVEIFCSQLSLDPSFFARHLRVTRWESSSSASNAPPLPSSAIDGGRSFLLCYPEIAVFPKELVVFPEDGINRRCYYCDCHLYREITFTKRPDPNSNDFKPSNIGVIRRKLSFWSRKYDNGAWVGEL
jgi:hypothetical protein